MKQTNTFDCLKGSLSDRNCSKRLNLNLSKLTGVLVTLGVSLGVSVNIFGIELGSPVAIASPRTERSNPYITIFNDSIYGPSRTLDGTVSGTLRSAIKYGWDFSAIAQDFQHMGLTEILSNQDSGDGNKILYTVFVPTNEEWQTLDPAIRANPETLENILRYHIVPGAVTQAQLESGEIQTLSGATLTIHENPSGDRFVLNQDVEITSTLRTQNGVIVFVNKPLVPSQN
jgi:hypothetical protein